MLPFFFGCLFVGFVALALVASAAAFGSSAFACVAFLLTCFGCFLALAAFHESWNFPAGVSFALKQNMYWGGFCAFLPDISGLGGGGGPHSLQESANLRGEGGGGGGVDSPLGRGWDEDAEEDAHHESWSSSSSSS